MKYSCNLIGWDEWINTWEQEFCHKQVFDRKLVLRTFILVQSKQIGKISEKTKNIILDPLPSKLSKQESSLQNGTIYFEIKGMACQFACKNEFWEK